jgi:hypothetical protein
VVVPEATDQGDTAPERDLVLEEEGPDVLGAPVVQRLEIRVVVVVPLVQLEGVPVLAPGRELMGVAQAM